MFLVIEKLPGYYDFPVTQRITHMWHSAGKGPIWSFLETEILRKVDEMVKKSKKKDFPYFEVLGHQKHPMWAE